MSAAAPWGETVELHTLCLRVVSGGTPSRSAPEYFDGGTIPWMKTGEVKKGFVYSTAEHITELGLENSSAKLIPAKSVIVAMYGDGDTAGNVAINMVPLTTNQACCNFVIDPARADYRFLYYYLKGNYGNLVNLKLGGSQQNLNAATLKRFPVPAIPVPAQTKIAAMLSAYDDLIANNQRRIALLETMAEDIYREWFVRMRFPGHKAARLVHGLPDGWVERFVSDVADINGHSVRRGREPEVIRYVDISSVGTDEMAESEELAYRDAPGRARRLVRHGDVLWSSVRPGNMAYCLVIEPPANLVASTGFAVISPKQGTPFTYLYKAVTTQNFTDQMVAVAKGSAYPATSFGDFGKARIVWPNADLLDKFDQMTRPMYESAAGLRKVSANLRKQRDALLPRLISGKLTVDHLDIRMSPSMQAVAPA